MAKLVTVYHVDGYYLGGFPQAPLSTDETTAARLVRTGAYTRDGSGDGELFELSEQHLERLDTFYDPPDPPPGDLGSDLTPDPAPAGSPDSTEV